MPNCVNTPIILTIQTIYFLANRYCVTTYPQLIFDSATRTNLLLWSIYHYKNLLNALILPNLLCINLSYKKTKTVLIPPTIFFPIYTKKAAKNC